MSDTLEITRAEAAKASVEAHPAPEPAPAAGDRPHWEPRGNYDGETASVWASYPDGGVRGALGVHLRACCAAGKAAVDARAADLREWMRTRAVELVARAPEHARLAELRPQYDTARAAHAAALARCQGLTGKKAELERSMPAPKNLAARLVALQAETDQAEADRRRAEAELAAIAPLYRQAALAVETLLPGAVRDAWWAVHEDEVARLASRLREFLDAHAEELLELAVLARARRECPPPAAAALARLVLGPAEDGVAA